MAQDTQLSADEIIQILQNNPDVLANAKAEIVAQLRDRGYNVSEKDITDERLFGQIRSNDQVRQMASDYLVNAGFGPEQSEQPQTQDQQNGQQGQNENQGQMQGQSQGENQSQAQYPGQPSPTPTPQGQVFGQLPSRGTQTGNIGITGSRTTTQRRQAPNRPKAPGPPQEQYPLRNLPALRDLYTQTLPDETKLERFGAALFRNSTTTAEKANAPLSIPIGPDYVLGPGDELVIDYWGSSSQHI